MSVTVIRTSWATTDKVGLELLDSAIRNLRGDSPLRPVDVLVSSNQIGLSTRRRLSMIAFSAGEVSAATSTNFITFDQLASRLAEASLVSDSRHQLSRLVLLEHLRELLNQPDQEIQTLGRSEGGIEAMANFYYSFRELDGFRQDLTWPDDSRLRLIIPLLKAVRQSLSSRYFDRTDLLERATLLMNAESAALNPTICYLPFAYTIRETQMLKRIGELTELAVIYKQYGDHEIDTYMLSLALEVDPLCSAPSISVLEQNTNVTVTDALDPRDEVRSAIEAVQSALIDGAEMSQVEIAYTKEDPYLDYLRSQLNASELPFSSRRSVRLSDTRPAKILLKLLDLDDDDYAVDAVFNIMEELTTSESVGDHETLTMAQVSRWRNIAEVASISSGLNQWKPKLQTLIQQERQTPKGLRSRELGRLQLAIDLSEEIRQLLQTQGSLSAIIREAVLTDRNWYEWSSWLTRLVTGWLKEKTCLSTTNSESKSSKSYSDLSSIANLLVIAAAFRELPNGHEAINFARFATALKSEIMAAEFDEQPPGPAVTIRPIEHSTGSGPSLTVVVGLDESSFPSSRRQDSIFSGMQHKLEELGVPQLSPILRRRISLLDSVLSSDSALLISPRRGIIAGAQSRQSNLVSDMITRQTATEPGLRRLEVELRTNSIHFESLLSNAIAIDSHEVALLDAMIMHDSPRDDGYVGTNSGLSRRRELIRSRASAVFTGFDGVLEIDQESSESDLLYSPTGLEQWVECPYAYFVNRVLRIEPSSTKEEYFRLSPKDKGTLVHETLRHLFEVSQDGGRPDFKGTHRWTESDITDTLTFASRQIDELASVHRFGSELFQDYERSRILRGLQEAVQEENERLASQGSYPISAESPFGLEGVPPFRLALDGEETIELRGIIDRVDRVGESDIKVVDYKTGSSAPYRRINGDDPIIGGRRLQLPIYALAAADLTGSTTEVKLYGEYFFISERGSNRRISFAIDPSLVSRVKVVIKTIVDGIRDGIFIQAPIGLGEFDFSCKFCDPLGAKPGWHNRRFERKLHDLRVARYLDIVMNTQTNSGADSDD